MRYGKLKKSGGVTRLTFAYGKFCLSEPAILLNRRHHRGNYIAMRAFGGPNPFPLEKR
jgi:hypothetical protein